MDVLIGQLTTGLSLGSILLLAALGGVTPALIAGGHVHQYRASETRATHHVWAPSTAFIIPDRRQPRYGLKEVGYVEHRLAPDGLLNRMPGLFHGRGLMR